MILQRIVDRFFRAHPLPPVEPVALTDPAKFEAAERALERKRIRVKVLEEQARALAGQNGHVRSQ